MLELLLIKSDDYVDSSVELKKALCLTKRCDVSLSKDYFPPAGRGGNNNPRCPRAPVGLSEDFL